MKRFLLFRVIPVLLLGIIFGYLLVNKSSYVLLRYEDHAIETSLWFLCLLLILSYFVIKFLASLFFKVYRSGSQWNSWKHNRRSAAAHKNFYQGVLDYELGIWDKALKKFQLSAEYIDRPITAYLFAARAAQKLERTELSDEMLHLAIQAEPASSLAVGLVRVELLLAADQKETAQQVLEELKQTSPANHKVKNFSIEG